MLTSLLQHFKQEIRRELFVRQVRADHRLEEVEVGVADDSEKALGAARLVHDAYVARGILRPHPTGFHVGTHAASLSNWTFVATHDRSAIGTISLVIDSDAGLPMDRVYGCELTRLRRRSSCLAEVGALAVTPEFRHSGIIMLLMSATLRKAYDLAVNRLVIAIHPKAEPFYRDGESPAGDSAKKIGGAAIGGAILGAILGGGKGAVVGGTTGAGAGTAAVMAGDRNPATVAPGSIVSVRLSSPVTIQVEKQQ